jgi:hypothetical protein
MVLMRICGPRLLQSEIWFVDSDAETVEPEGDPSNWGNRTVGMSKGQPEAGSGDLNPKGNGSLAVSAWSSS